MPEFSSTVRRDTVELEREQTVVLRMLPGLSSAASDDDSLEMAEILHQAENGLASTLFKTVREEHALSYSVGMSFSAGFHPGTLSFYAMTAAGAGKQVMTLLNDEIRREFVEIAKHCQVQLFICSHTAHLFHCDNIMKGKASDISNVSIN